MEDGLYELIKEVIQEIKTKVNYNNFEHSYPQNERPTTTSYCPDGSSDFPYYLDISEKEKVDKSVDGNYSFKGYEINSKNLIFDGENKYINDIQIEFWKKINTVNSKASYSISVKYKFDKNFIKKQSPLFMGWFVSQFNHTFETINGYYDALTLKMDYVGKYAGLSVNSKKYIDDIPDESNYYEIEQFKMKIREFITVATLRFLYYTERYNWTYERSKHFCDEIYSCIVGIEEIWNDVININLEKFNKENLKNSIDALHTEFIEDWEYNDWLEDYKSSAESDWMDIAAGN